MPVHDAPSRTRLLPRVTARPTTEGSEETSATWSVPVGSTPEDPETVRTDSATEARPEVPPGSAVAIRCRTKGLAARFSAALLAGRSS